MAYRTFIVDAMYRESVTKRANVYVDGIATRVHLHCNVCGVWQQITVAGLHVFGDEIKELADYDGHLPCNCYSKLHQAARLIRWFFWAVAIRWSKREQTTAEMVRMRRGRWMVARFFGAQPRPTTNVLDRAKTATSFELESKIGAAASTNYVRCISLGHGECEHPDPCDVKKMVG